MDYDGKGTLLDVGCGPGALSIRAVFTWQETKVVGMDYWAAVYNYSQVLCKKNAADEGAGLVPECKESAGKNEYSDTTRK